MGGLSLGGDDGELISVDVTLTAQVVAVAPLFARTFAAEIVARAEHSDAVAKQINEPNFKTTLASSDHLGTSVLFEDIKPIAYSSVNVAPPAVAATPAPTPEPKQLKGLGESNIRGLMELPPLEQASEKQSVASEGSRQRACPWGGAALENARGRCLALNRARVLTRV